MTSETISAQNIINLFGTAPPLTEFLEHMTNISAGLSAANEAATSFASNDAIRNSSDSAFQKLNETITKYFQQASDDYNFSLCPLRINGSIYALTDRVKNNITTSWYTEVNIFNQDYMRKRNFLSNIFVNFRNEISNCGNLRPLPDATVCIQNLVSFVSGFSNKFFNKFYNSTDR